MHTAGIPVHTTGWHLDSHSWRPSPLRCWPSPPTWLQSSSSQLALTVQWEKLPLTVPCPWQQSFHWPLNTTLVTTETSLCQQYSQSCGFFSSRVRMSELDHEEGWAPKSGCFRIVVLEKTLESPLDSKQIKPVSPEGNQPWIFTVMTDAEAEAPILWPPEAKSWFIGKDLDAGKDWGQDEKGVTEDEMVIWHHQLNGHGFE